MLKIFTRAMFYTLVFNSGIIIGGLYTDDIVDFAQSLSEYGTIEKPAQQKPAPNKKQKRLVRTTV